MDKIIDDVKTFLKNTRELIIFNVQDHPEDGDQKFVQKLINEFRQWLVKPGSKNWNMTLRDVWETKIGMAANQGRIIIHYSEKSDHSDNDNFFPTPYPGWSGYSWANKDKPCELVEVLQKKVSCKNTGI